MQLHLIFIIVIFLLLCHNYLFLIFYKYVIYFFDVVTFYVFYFGTFKLGLEITVQLRFVFARHCDGILWCRNDVVLWRHNYIIYLFDVVMFFHNVIFWYVWITYGNNVIITFRFSSPLWRIFLLRHNYVIYLFVVVTFLMTLEIRYILVCSNYVLKLRFKLVIF